MTRPALRAEPLLASVPTLDEIAEDPARVADLPADTRAALQCRALATLAALCAAPAQPSLSRPVPPIGAAELLGTREVATILGVSVSWVEKHVDELPPRRSLCGAPRWLRADVLRWIKMRPEYGRTD